MKPVTRLNPAAEYAAPDTLNVADLTCLAEQITDSLHSDAGNDDRAGAAAAALVTFARLTRKDHDGGPAAAVITDLLDGLMHLCSGTDLPFCELLIAAGEHFGSEAE